MKPSGNSARVTIIVEYGDARPDERFEFPPSSTLTPKVISAVAQVLQLEASRVMAEFFLFEAKRKRGDIVIWPHE